MSHVRVLPSARRLLGSLRDLGYELPQAVAELVDNSIDADATEVRIDVIFDGEASHISVADNGRGMGADEIDEAMRLGSEGRYGGASLGGFGLGLKTASFSQCRVLTVASRRRRGAPLEARRWDLDDAALADDWLLERVEPSEIPASVGRTIGSRRGTVVLWQGLDRLTRFKDPTGSRAEAALHEVGFALERHLAMVFHRFLSGEARRRLPLSVLVNGEPIRPWDPFARDEPATRELPETTLVLRENDRSHPISVRPFVLPSQQRFSSPEAHRSAGGPRKWNRQQGFYVYRADRLIQSGGWNRLRTQDEHTKLARVSLDFPREADELFGVNVSKMRVLIPEQLRPDLRALIAGVVGAAQDSYRTRSGASPSPRGSHAPGAQVAPDDRVSPRQYVDALVDVSQEFIPRAVAVSLLRGELTDQPETLRRLVHRLISEPWAPEGLDAASDEKPGPEAVARAGG